MKTPIYRICPSESKDLDTLLDEISVLSPGEWHNKTGPKKWYAVCDDTGIIAYFGNETDAFRFRLDLINRKLNP